VAGIAWAQTGAAAGGPSPIVSMMPIALMFVVLYFLLIRPQQKQRREHESIIESLKRNDEIVTSGGIYGRIQSIADKVLVVEIAPNVRVRLDRAQVATLVKAGKAEDVEKGKEKS